MKNKTKSIIFAILIIINCVIIFYFSHQVADDSSMQSSRIVNLICNMIPVLRNYEEILTIIVRKTAHFSIYAMLGLLTTNFMLTIENKRMYKIVLIPLVFCFIYAITDEIHQLFIPGRSGKIGDVLIDTLGAIVGIFLVVAVTTLTRKIKSKNNRNNRKDMLEDIN